MKPEKEKWINDILNSTDGMQRAEPDPFLFAKVRNRLTETGLVEYIPVRTVWVAITSFAMLVLLNWRVISRQWSMPAPSDSTQLNTVVSEMQLYPTTHQPYDLWSEQNY